MIIPYQDYIALRDSGHVILTMQNPNSFQLELKQAHPITGEPKENIVERVNPPQILQGFIAKFEEEIKTAQKTIAGIRAMIEDEISLIPEPPKEEKIA